MGGSPVAAGLRVVGIETKLVGGECPYWAPSKMMIRADNLLAAARRIKQWGTKGSSGSSRTDSETCCSVPRYLPWCDDALIALDARPRLQRRAPRGIHVTITTVIADRRISLHPRCG